MDVDEKQAKVNSMLEGITIDDIKLNGMVIRIGDKVLGLTEVEEIDVDLIEHTRCEYRDKLKAVLLKIREQINSEISELKQAAILAKQEFERKEREWKEKLANANVMPEITVDHAAQGVSVVKGDGNGEICWLVKGNYTPHTLDGKPLDPKIVKKLATPVTFLIRTRESRIQEVSTRRCDNMGYFDHYHQHNPDCWGRWSYFGKVVNSPEDALRIAGEAMGVLENINTASLAQRKPRGLPTIETVEKNLKKLSKEEKRSMIKDVNKKILKEGGVIYKQTEDIWDVWTAN